MTHAQHGRRVLIAMPFAKGTGMAWRYIERLVNDVARELERRGASAQVCYPSGADGASGVDEIDLDLYDGSIGALRHAQREIRARLIDTIYFAHDEAFAVRYLAARIAGVRRIVCHYHHAGGATGPARGLPRLARAFRRRIPGYMADHAICVSGFVRQLVIDASLVPSERVSVVHNGILPEDELTAATARALRDEWRWRLGVASDEPLVVCASRANLEKGLDTLLAGFDALCTLHVRDGRPLPRLAYAGDGPHLELLEEQRRSLGHGDRITFLGRTDAVTVRALLCAADVAALVPRYEEAFGLFAVEAMQQGVPVVLTRRGGLAEVIVDGRGGHYVPCDDVPVLGRTLHRMLADGPALGRMGAEARERARTAFPHQRSTTRITELLLD